MAYFRITLLRSAIGLPASRAGVLRALGLRKRMATVYHPVSPQVAGQIFAVKELVDVHEVSEKMTKEEMRESRKPDRGYFIESKAGRGEEESTLTAE
ncbi:MAG: 39S ribosomal protein L33, mitochondrial [Bogoriella megaspora]|nr:MAG: 39S ribosomal protein L33, mitochondrial [Bogoriella megaspora]